jgi:heptosyltransferase-2
LEKYGLSYDGSGTEIFIPGDTKARISEAIKSAFQETKSGPLIGIVPSAQWPGKRWPSEYFKKLVGIIGQKLDVNIIVIAGRRDVSFCQDIVSENSNAVSFAGNFTIIESAAALSLCSIVVANDTGMMHVAEAVGTRVIGIMGPTSEEFGCYPYMKASSVIEKKLWCRPCSKNGSGVCIRFGKRPCLGSISPEEVFSRLKAVL